MKQLPSEILELILSYIPDSDLLDLCQTNENINKFCDSSFWSHRAVSKGYIKNLEKFGHEKSWPEGKVTERYIQVLTLSVKDCVPGSEKYIHWNGICEYNAGIKGDITTINYFLNKSNSNNVLWGAIYGGHLEVVKYLIEEKKVICIDGALYRAAKGGHIDIVKYLIGEQGTAYINDALYEAVLGGRIDIVKYLITKGADNLDDALEEAVSGRHIDIVKYLIAKGATNLDNALEVAIERKYTELIEYLEQLISQRT